MINKTVSIATLKARNNSEGDSNRNLQLKNGEKLVVPAGSELRHDARGNLILVDEFGREQLVERAEDSAIEVAQAPVPVAPPQPILDAPPPPPGGAGAPPPNPAPPPTNPAYSGADAGSAGWTGGVLAGAAVLGGIGLLLVVADSDGGGGGGDDEEPLPNRPPQITTSPAQSIVENTTSVVTVAASDPDGGDTRTFSIGGGDDANFFSINPGSGALSFKTAPDFETRADKGANNVYDVVVRVTDKAGLFDDRGFQIAVTDFDESNRAPVIAGGESVEQSVAENSGAVFYNVVATDEPGSVLAFSVSGTDAAFFTISNTGALRLTNPQDFENAQDAGRDNKFNIVVKATDSGGLSDTQAVVVNLTNDLNETTQIPQNAPTILDQTRPTTGDPAFLENSPIGAAVGRPLDANDVDFGNTFTFSIIGGNQAGAFQINAGSGQITVADSRPLDFETTDTFRLTVRVTDNTGLTDDGIVTIRLSDMVNEAPTTINRAPVFVDPTAPVTIEENKATGTVVATVVASDPDANDMLRFSIANAGNNGAFAISNTGVVTVANSALLNFETTPTFALTVNVTDRATGGLSDFTTLTVNLTNVNEAPTIAAQSRDVTVGTQNGASVGTPLTATDPEGGATTFTITGGTGENAFDISPTGQITVENSTLLMANMPLSLLVSARDAQNNASSATVTVNVQAMQSQTRNVNVNQFGDDNPDPVVVSNSENAGDANVLFDFESGAYTYTVSTFGQGDRLTFDPGTNFDFSNNLSATDNMFPIQVNAGGASSQRVIVLTNLPAGADSMVNSLESFNMFFGANSLAAV